MPSSYQSLAFFCTKPSTYNKNLGKFETKINDEPKLVWYAQDRFPFPPAYSLGHAQVANGGLHTVHVHGDVLNLGSV